MYINKWILYTIYIIYNKLNLITLKYEANG